MGFCAGQDLYLRCSMLIIGFIYEKRHTSDRYARRRQRYEMRRGRNDECKTCRWLHNNFSLQERKRVFLFHSTKPVMRRLLVEVLARCEPLSMLLQLEIENPIITEIDIVRRDTPHSFFGVLSLWHIFIDVLQWARHRVAGWITLFINVILVARV